MHQRQLQMQVVSAQIAAINAQHRLCPVCQSQRRIKDYHEVNFRSLFGKVCVRVPRFDSRSCPCLTTVGDGLQPARSRSEVNNGRVPGLERKAVIRKADRRMTVDGRRCPPKAQARLCSDGSCSAEP